MRSPTCSRPTWSGGSRDDDETVIVVWDGRGIAVDGQPYENSYAWIMKLAAGAAAGEPALGRVSSGGRRSQGSIRSASSPSRSGMGLDDSWGALRFEFSQAKLHRRLARSGWSWLLR